MTGNLLAIGKTGLYAAQAALSTTGHNISNANVAGYSRQVVVQSTSPVQDRGYGFLGTGTQISQIKRYSDSFLNTQVRNAQASTSGLESYYAQIKQIDNLLADQTSGLSPMLDAFFKGVQDVVANKGLDASRQSMLSASQSLASRFQSLDARLSEIREGVNSEITSSVTAINAYAEQIADLNRQIVNFATTDQRAPNDLLDQRDQLVLELNKYVKASVTPSDGHSLTISIGNGQPLVIGTDTYKLAVMQSPTDLTRLEVGYQLGTKVSVLPDGALTGGSLGGVLDFRTTTLDTAQGMLGKIALGVAMEFNQQHKLGLDQTGTPGIQYFAESPSYVGKSINNSPASTAELTAKVLDVGALKDSDYEVRFDGTNYTVTRLKDNQPTVVTPDAAGNATLVLDGVEMTFSGSGRMGDTFLVRPTINAASGFKVLLTDPSQIAAAVPITSNVPTSNTGSVAVTDVAVNQDFLTGAPALPVTLAYDGPSGNLTGFPAGATVTVVDITGASQDYPAASVPFSNGATYKFNGVEVTLSGGAPGNGDEFTIKSNANGVGDTGNMLKLGALQTKNIFNGGNATITGSYAQLVSAVGNKTREVQVNALSGNALLEQAYAAALDVSGVNLDEEAANLLKYQQAYQASSKVMQIAGTIFEALLSIAR